LERLQSIRIFITGRPNIQAEIGKRLAGQVKGVSLNTNQDDIINYPRIRPDEDETPDAMD